MSHAVTSTNGLKAFFEYARERQAILLRRRSGQKPPWTDDPILQQNRFCCVFREDDKTTAWFRESVREPMRHRRDVILATALFRWFNRIESGEAMFLQHGLFGNNTAFENFRETGKIDGLRLALLNYIGPDGPFLTSSHMVNVEPGLPMPDAVLVRVQALADSAWGLPELWTSIEGATKALQEHRGIGRFLAYEIATDLRHTRVLENAPDIMTWASKGPGSERGWARVFYEGDASMKPTSMQDFLDGCAFLLSFSAEEQFWPYEQRWEMRDVEHTLCEFDKYIRTMRGEGSMKGVGRWEAD